MASPEKNHYIMYRLANEIAGVFPAIFPESKLNEVNHFNETLEDMVLVAAAILRSSDGIKRD